jgi:hypothetical protein
MQYGIAHVVDEAFDLMVNMYADLTEDNSSIARLMHQS